MKNPRLIALATVIIAWSCFATGSTAIAAPSSTVVMTGLDNPRGLTFGKDGALYVAEAGRGGSGPCTVLRGQEVCFGRTGAVTRLHEGVQQRLVTGLPSYAPSTGEGATGPHDASLRRGRIYIPIGLGPNRPPFAPRSILIWVAHPRAEERHVEKGRRHRRVRAGSQSRRRTPESNPYGLLAGAGGRLVVGCRW